MSRRRVVAIVSASVLFLLGFFVVGAVVAVTRTGFGRERVRRFLTETLAAALRGRGTIYIGHLGGNFLTGVTIDSLVIRDAEDSLFVATGPIRARFDPRDLVDKRILLRALDISRPYVNLRRHADREWNFDRIFPHGPPKPRTAERGFGGYVVLDSVVLHDGTVVLTEPWDPPESLRGARRDSAIRAAIADTTHVIRETAEGPKQTRTWTHLNAQLPYARITYPDSAGRLIRVARMDVHLDDPPLKVHGWSGPVRILGDSVWFSTPHFALPASSAGATGKVWWGSDLPVRYDVRVDADSVSMSDVAWVYPTLPETGGGRLHLTISNDPRDLHVLNYALSDMDMRSTRSHVRGGMTFGVGGPVLVVKDVALSADPLDFDFLRTLNGGPFPVDWQGQFYGTLRGRGGPVDRFAVDDARLVFRDAHVPGATTRITAQGGIDILHPARAIFRGLDVRVDSLDLRTVRYLFPNFPRLQGLIVGSARLDSVWTDVRASNADLEHVDGPGLPSHVTGSARITYGERYLTFEAALDASPVSFTSLQHSYPTLPLRGQYHGPIRVQGTLADLLLQTTLTGAAGAFSLDGRLDIEQPGYGARGTASGVGLDLAALLDRSTLPRGRLTGAITGDLRGDSLANLDGRATVTLDSAQVGALRVAASRAELAFAGGVLHVDSMRLATSAARITARGALGLAPGITDTLRYAVVVDSLGGLRAWIPRPWTPPAPPLPTAPGEADSAAAHARALRDSLAGTLHTDGILVGSVDTLQAHGTVTGESLFLGGESAAHLDGEYALRGLPHAPAGTLSGILDSVLVAGVHLDTLSSVLGMLDRSTGSVSLGATSHDPAGSFRAFTLLAFHRGADSLRLTVDSAAVGFRDHAWSLAEPAHVLSTREGTSVDSVLARSGTGGVLAFHGRFPVAGPVDAALALDSVPLADFGALLQTQHALDGRATGRLSVSGTRADPALALDGRVTDLTYGDLHFPFFTLHGSYANRRFGAGLEVYRDGRGVMTVGASVPVDLALARVPHRFLDDTLGGHLDADSVDLSLLETLSPQLKQVSGNGSAHLRLAGTWRHPLLIGGVRLHDGSARLARVGIGLRSVQAEVDFAPDSIRITQLAMTSPGQPGSALAIEGSIAVPNYADRRTYGFDLTLRARNFEALNRRSLAQLVFSGAAQLTGTVPRPVLTGDLTIDRGAFFLSELGAKQVIDLNDPEFFNIVDTSLVGNRDLLEVVPPFLDTMLTNLRVPNLTIRIGDDVWLRSEEANIKLAGSMDLSKFANQRLESGTLRVSRGTYRLDLGPVQRTFQVDSGYVTFYGDPHIPAELNVWATYTVRQANRELGQDVKIVAHIGGTLREPRLELTSEERIALSQTEILSYLLFGQPSFASGADAANAGALRSVAAALLPSVGAVLERALADQLNFIDYVQVQTGSAGEQDPFSTLGAQNVLSGTRIGVGKQIGERTFVTVNAGLCQLAGGTATTSFAQSLGVTVEHRMGDGFSLQASLEPSTLALQCRPGLTNIGTRPPQYGFDLFREWSF